MSAVESQSGKKAIINHVLSGCDVLFHWSMLSVDIRDDKDGLELLRHVVELWLLIEGLACLRHGWKDISASNIQ